MKGCIYIKQNRISKIVFYIKVHLIILFIKLFHTFYGEFYDARLTDVIAIYTLALFAHNPPGNEASREVANLTEIKQPYFSGRAWELKIVILQKIKKYKKKKINK